MLKQFIYSLHAIKDHSENATDFKQMKFRSTVKLYYPEKMGERLPELTKL
jgi:hypothetical protein